MAIPPGTYNFGPQNGKLLVKTGREGMGGKMGHDLTIEVGRWSATADVAEDPSASSLTATAEVGSMEVVSGEGGVKPLSDGDKVDIKKTIIDKILGDTKIEFKSTSCTGGGSSATVQGDLTIAGKTAPAQFQLQDLGGGRIKATGQVVQSNHGVKPFKAFMGALKVKDAVNIELEATVPGA
ncbi:MAG TPA: YceI family protein [Actinomycetota bacterium]|nr:YceI family protein [Actinomycetota bacterium]